MKILLTASSSPDTIAWNYTKYLSELKEVDLVPVYTFDTEEGPDQQGISQKLLRKLSPGLMTRRISGMLERSITIHRPDVLIIIKGMHIAPQLLARCRQNGIFLVNYNPDHPFDFETIASGNRNILESLPLYDLVCTYSPVIEDAVNKKYHHLKTAIIPFGYSPSVYTENKLDSMSLIRRVCFAGTADQDRAEQIGCLLDQGIEVDVYGKGYERWLGKKRGLRIFPAIFSGDYYNKLQSYAVSLNLYRKQNHGGHNMRSFEIPAVGGLQVVEFSNQMSSFFKDREEVFMYASDQERLETIQFLLSLSEDQLRSMKTHVRDKTLRSGYSYADRAKELHRAIQSSI